MSAAARTARAAVTRREFVGAAGAAAAAWAARAGGGWGGAGGAAGIGGARLAGAAEGAGAAGGAGRAAERLRLVQATDLHFISPRLTDHGAYFEALIRASDAKAMEYSEEMADAFVDQMLRERPDAVLVTGDLTYNGAVESHEDLAEKLARLPDAGVPVLVLPGNHDVDCPQAARFEGGSFERVPSATAEQFARIWGRFGYEGALSRDDASLSYVAELGAGGRLRALMLDCNAVEEPGAIPGATLAWAREQLEEAREAGARVIACSHQNVLQHAFVAYGYQMVGAEELLALYRDEGVVLNLGGHIHAQHYARPGEAGGAGEAPSLDGADDAAAAPFVDVATSALSVSPNQFAELYVRLLEPGGTGGSSGSSGADGLPVGGRLLDAAGAPLPAIAVSYATRQLDVSGWAARQGSDNPDLLGFAAYAREFFRASTRASFSSAAEGAADAGADELLAYIDVVNYGFFSGRLDLVEDRPDLDRRWAAASALSGLYLDYIFRIDPVRDENAFDVEG